MDMGIKGWVRLAAVVICLVSTQAQAYDATGAVLKMLSKGVEALSKEQPERRGSGTSGGPVDVRLGPVGFQNCKHLFPGGRPLDTSRIDRRWRVTELCFDQFAVVYSKLSKSPLIVVEKLNRTVLEDATRQQRTDVFFPDERIKPGERAELSDFAGSGYDRGHLASAGNQGSANAMAQSFSLVNVVLQDSFTNQKGAWIKAEKDTRKYIRRAAGDVWVYSGPLFNGDVQTKGRNRVWVPSDLFKLVYDGTTGRSWAHIVGNNGEANLGKPLNYEAFVKATGLAVLGGQ